MDQDELLQPEPIYLSSDEDTVIHYLMSDEELPKDNDSEWLNQFLVRPSVRTNVAEDTIPTYNVNMPALFPSAITESQVSKKTHNVSPETADYYFQTRPHPVEFRQVLPTRDPPETLTPSNKGPTKPFKLYNLPETPPHPTILNYCISVQLCRSSKNWHFMLILKWTREYQDALCVASPTNRRLRKRPLIIHNAW